MCFKHFKRSVDQMKPSKSSPVLSNSQLVSSALVSQSLTLMQTNSFKMHRLFLQPNKSGGQSEFFINRLYRNSSFPGYSTFPWINSIRFPNHKFLCVCLVNPKKQTTTKNEKQARLGSSSEEFSQLQKLFLKGQDHSDRTWEAVV